MISDGLKSSKSSMAYKPSIAGLITHFSMLAVAVLSLTGAIFEMKRTSFSLEDNRNWASTKCTSQNVTCGADADSYINHCTLTGFYATSNGSALFTIDDFDDLSPSEIMDKYDPEYTFKCYVDTRVPGEVFIDPPAISIDFLFYEYLLTVFVAIVIGYGIKYWAYVRFETHFVPSPLWHTAVDDIWGPKLRESMDYPFNNLVLQDMSLFMMIFTIVGFVNSSSLNHIYGFAPIILLGIFGSFEKYPNPSIFLHHEVKVHYIIANYATGYSWCLVNIFSKIALASRDPFPDYLTYVFSPLAFIIYLAFKIYYFKMASNLFRLYYSNETVEAKTQ